MVKLISASENRVVLAVSTGSLDRAQVATLLTPHRLGFHLLAKDQAPLRPSRAGMKGPKGVRAETDQELGLVWLADRCEPLEPLGKKAALPPDQLVSCICEDYRPPAIQCRLIVLEREPMVAGTSLSHAFPTLSPEGVADVSMTFDDKGRRLLAERTRSAIGRRMAMVLDDKALIAPLLYEPIENGRLRMTVGTEQDTGAQLLKAHTLAIAISASMLKGRWAVEEVVRLPGKNEL